VSPFVTISIGIASVVPNQSLSTSQVVAMADEALYRAKQFGRNQSVQADLPAGDKQTPG
jgi:diguanylate cyclase (GGDEF)-like protein